MHLEFHALRRLPFQDSDLIAAEIRTKSFGTRVSTSEPLQVNCGETKAPWIGSLQDSNNTFRYLAL